MLGYDLDPGARANPTYVYVAKDPAMPIYAAKKFADVDGRRMAYIDEGAGGSIVFQHGNPTSSYLWRNVMPRCAGLGRLVACDLIGMGDSDKLSPSGPGRYTYAEQRHYLFALWDKLDLGDKIVLVLHDWGSALGFDWAYRHQSAVRAIAYMEAFVATIDTWDDWPPEAVAFFRAIRSAAGEELVLQQNLFVEQVLPSEVLHGLTEEEMAVYRRPYLDPGESRRPTLTWPREGSRWPVSRATSTTSSAATARGWPRRTSPRCSWRPFPA